MSHPPSAKVCPRPGCPNLQPCDKHRRPADLRKSPTARGYDRRWRRKADQYRSAHPTCEHPDCDRPSVDVDHLDGLGPNGPRGYDDDNLEALCHPHHSSKTATVDGGFGNKPKAGWGTTANP